MSGGAPSRGPTQERDAGGTGQEPGVRDRPHVTTWALGAEPVAPVAERFEDTTGGVESFILNGDRAIAEMAAQLRRVLPLADAAEALAEARRALDPGVALDDRRRGLGLALAAIPTACAPEWLALFAAMARHELPEVRLWAALALARWRWPEGSQVLADLTLDGEERVASTAGTALAMMVEGGIIEVAPAPRPDHRPRPGRPAFPPDDSHGRPVAAYLLPPDVHLPEVSRHVAAHGWRFASAQRAAPLPGEGEDDDPPTDSYERVAWRAPGDVEVVFDLIPTTGRARLAFIGAGGDALARPLVRPLGLEGAEALTATDDSDAEGDTRGLALIHLAALWARSWEHAAPPGAEPRIALLRRYLADPEPVVRECALKAVVIGLGWSELRDDVARVAAADPDELVRLLARHGLGLLDRASPG